MVVDMKIVYTFNMSDHISTSELVVDGSVDGKGNKEGKMAADIRIYLLCWNLL